MPHSVLSADAVSFGYRDRIIFENLTFRIHGGDRTAVVGANGSGKSTLLRLLAGSELPTAGSINRLPSIRQAWLPQASGASASGSVARELSELIGVGPAERQLDDLTERLGRGELDLIDAQTVAVERWTALGGADFGARLGPALEAAGISRTWAGRSLDSLSGGQLARVRIAALHLARLDLALLDEPSNHLDVEGLEMLEATIKLASYPIVFASHDRNLLNRVATDVLEIERGRTRLYRGGWSTYLREREVERRGAEVAYSEAVTERDRLVRMDRRIREQAEVGERRVRRSDEPSKAIRIMSIESAQKNTAASGIRKRIDLVEVPAKPWRENNSRLLLDADQAVHAPSLVTMREVVLAWGSWQSEPISLTIAPGERVLLSGPNGSGKSTLIATLAGRLRPDSGAIKRPASARFVEMAQAGTVFTDTGESLVDSFRELSGLGETEARTALAAMRLGQDLADRPPAGLSPGERTRAELALLAQRPAACLLLDEPSNHLDLEALGVLEGALTGWSGALVLASHDRELRNRIKTDRVIEIP